MIPVQNPKHKILIATSLIILIVAGLLVWYLNSPKQEKINSTSFSASGCDQSATTTDCSTLPIDFSPNSNFPPAVFYTDVASTSQSGKIDVYLTIDNELNLLRFCGKIYKARQIYIDGVDIVRRISEIFPAEECTHMPADLSFKKSVIEIPDVKYFSGSDVGLPGTTYMIYIVGNIFDINPATGNIYRVSAFDGSLGDSIGTLWKTHINNDLGISFSYPGHDEYDGNWGIGRGDKGASFQATIPLSSGSVIYGYAFSSDYEVGKGAPGVSTEGYTIQDGKYYVLRRSKPSEVSFLPDEIWDLHDGSKAVVVFGKDYNTKADYPDAPVKALVNLPGPIFTGIGFILFNDGFGQHPATPEDLAVFKKIITSIKILR